MVMDRGYQLVLQQIFIGGEKVVLFTAVNKVENS